MADKLILVKLLRGNYLRKIDAFLTMLYPFKYDLSATSGYFYLTMSSDVVYYQYEPVNLEKLVISLNKKSETSS